MNGVSLMRLKQVLQVIPVSKSTLWQWVKDNKFPAPHKLSERCTVWDADSVFGYLEKMKSQPSIPKTKIVRGKS